MPLHILKFLSCPKQCWQKQWIYNYLLGVKKYLIFFSYTNGLTKIRRIKWHVNFLVKSEIKVSKSNYVFRNRNEINMFQHIPNVVQHWKVDRDLLRSNSMYIEILVPHGTKSFPIVGSSWVEYTLLDQTFWAQCTNLLCLFLSNDTDSPYLYKLKQRFTQFQFSTRINMMDVNEAYSQNPISSTCVVKGLRMRVCLSADHQKPYLCDHCSNNHNIYCIAISRSNCGFIVINWGFNYINFEDRVGIRLTHFICTQYQGKEHLSLHPEWDCPHLQTVQCAPKMLPRNTNVVHLFANDHWYLSNRWWIDVVSCIFQDFNLVPGSYFHSCLSPR